MDKMILKDNTTVELQTGASLSAVTAKFDSKDAMLETWKTLTLENLAEVKFQNNAGMTVGTYKDLILESETSQEVSDGVQTTFSFRAKTDTEKRLDALEEVLHKQYLVDLLHLLRVQNDKYYQLL